MIYKNIITGTGIALCIFVILVLLLDRYCDSSDNNSFNIKSGKQCGSLKNPRFDKEKDLRQNDNILSKDILTSERSEIENGYISTNCSIEQSKENEAHIVISTDIEDNSMVKPVIQTESTSQDACSTNEGEKEDVKDQEIRPIQVFNPNKQKINPRVSAMSREVKRQLYIDFAIPAPEVADFIV